MDKNAAGSSNMRALGLLTRMTLGTALRDSEFKAAASIATISGSVALAVVLWIDDEASIRRFYAQTNKALLGLWVLSAALVWFSFVTHAQFACTRLLTIATATLSN